MLKKWLCVAAAMLGLNAAIDSARAQNYPARAITLVIPFAPGGSTSIVGRGIADKMSELLGEKVVVDNCPGAGVRSQDRDRRRVSRGTAPVSSRSQRGGNGARAQIMLTSREVILAAGAFNSPQLLKLSGIGPHDELTQHGISTIVNLPGVGQNLQDRYEVGIVTELESPLTFASACRPTQPGDPCYTDWLVNGAGPYTSTGAFGAMLVTSKTAKKAKRPDPDLFIFGAGARFRGYFPGYSFTDIAGHNDHTPGRSSRGTRSIAAAR